LRTKSRTQCAAITQGKTQNHLSDNKLVGFITQKNLVLGFSAKVIAKHRPTGEAIHA